MWTRFLLHVILGNIAEISPSVVTMTKHLFTSKNLSNIFFRQFDKSVNRAVTIVEHV